MGDPLPDTAHVSRYGKPSAVDADGLPLPAVFQLRPGEDHLSVNWLEYFDTRDQAAAIDQVRQTFEERGFRLRPNGRFVALNVGEVKRAISEAVAAVAWVEHLPLENDESHSGIFGYSEADFAVAVELRALVGQDDVYSATTPSS